MQQLPPLPRLWSEEEFEREQGRSLSAPPGGDGGPPGGDGGPPGGDGDSAPGDNNDAWEPDDDETENDSDGDNDEFFKIHVKLPWATVETYTVEVGDTMRQVKGIIRDKVGIPRCHQRLVLQGVPVDDADAAIEEAKYELLLRVAGGGKAVKKQVALDRKAAMSHRYTESLKRALAVSSNRGNDNGVFEAVKTKMVDINTKLQRGEPIIKSMIAELTDPEAVKEIKSIMLTGTGGGGGNLPEARASKLAKFFVGECYVEALAQKERYDLLLESMQTMSVSMFAAEFYSDVKDTYQFAEFRKILEEKLLILNHIALNNVIQGVSALSIGSSESMQD